MFYSDACHRDAVLYGSPSSILPRFSCHIKVALSLPPLKDNVLGPNDVSFPK